jgi:hypothetical protein
VRDADRRQAAFAGDKQRCVQRKQHERTHLLRELAEELQKCAWYALRIRGIERFSKRRGASGHGFPRRAREPEARCRGCHQSRRRIVIAATGQIAAQTVQLMHVCG